MKSSIFVPADTYSVSEGSYIIRVNGYKTYDYNSETNTSEYFINKIINNIINDVDFSKDSNEYYIYNNQNYITYDYYDVHQRHIAILSNVSDLPLEDYWMYPQEPIFYLLHTINFPVTRTISIIIDSSSLPVYTIDKDITLEMELLGSHKTLLIPSGEYTYSTIDNIIFDFVNQNNNSNRFTNYYNLPYFQYSRYISSTNGSLIIRNNNDFNKYYGLLHMVYTYPADINFDTTKLTRKFSTNMAPVYRSLNIPTGFYTPEEFVNYINTHSEYHYTRAGVDSLSYTQFLAKIVDNDIVIYTDDDTKFFINPICKMNTYQESNFASEHRLCTIDYIPYYTDSIIVKQGEQINISADKLKIKLSDNTIATNYTIICKSLPDGLTWSNNILTGVLNNEGIYTVDMVINIGDDTKNLKILFMVIK